MRRRVSAGLTNAQLPRRRQSEPAGQLRRGLTGAASQTERFRGVVSRAAGGAAAALRRTAGAAAGVGDVVGRTARRSTSGLQRVAVAAGNAAGALERTAGAARRVGTASRRMADTVGSAMGRARGRVDNLIGRFRVLERTSRNAGGVMSGGVGRVVGAAGGIYGASRVVGSEADLSSRYALLAENAKLSLEEERQNLRQRIEAAAEAAHIPRAPLVTAATEEFALTGDIAAILADLPSIARVLAMDPNTAGADLGKFRAQLRNFKGMGAPEERERAMLQALEAASVGALPLADIARSGVTAMVAQTETFGHRDFGTSWISPSAPGWGSARPSRP